jgi:CarD family transcriptional regulator
MFNIGEMIIYSSHGVCCIDDICARNFHGEEKKFYVLHPLDNEKLTISIPVDSTSVKMLELLNEDQAEEILDSFRLPGKSWIEITNERAQIFAETVKTGNRKEISKVVNTLMRRKLTCEIAGKKLNDKDKQLLSHVQGVLFMELAIALSTTYDAILERVTSMISPVDLDMECTE